ncbi:MAG: glycosyltransferase family 4 protein [Verrucomicrobia bacterium]|nr:glycosyltransferase family 4 protein [Verrucomicrobiota bacterium]
MDSAFKDCFLTPSARPDPEEAGPIPTAVFNGLPLPESPAPAAARFGLLCGGFPPRIDGIGDYTWRLSRELAQQGCPVQVLTSEARLEAGDALPRSLDATAAGLESAGITVTRCFDPDRPATLRSLADHLAPDLDWLVVQYNPFGFGPRGFNPWLIEALTAIRRRSRTCIAVMFHETYVPAWPWKFTVMRLWQWPQFLALTRLAHAIFVSSERWIGQVHACTPRAVCIHLPVGSNLPCCPFSKAEARQRLGIDPETKVLGAFGSGHVSKLSRLVRVAAEAVQRRFPDTILLSVGKGGRTLRAECPELNLRDEGPLPPEEAALRIRAMDVMLGPFADGLSTRRGSAITALQHGVPVCSTVTRWTDGLLVDPPWAGIKLCAPNQPHVYAQNALDLIAQPPSAEEIRQRHDAVFGWPNVTARLLAFLDPQVKRSTDYTDYTD